MPKSRGMGALSPRQAEILGLIGIEVWRRRTDQTDFPAAPSPDTPSNARSGADREQAGTAGAGFWHLAGGESDPVRDIWVFCSDSAQFLESNPSAKRLLEEILAAMGLALGDVSLFHPGDGRADADTPRSARQLLEARSGKSPTQVVALGRDCSEWARAHMSGVEPGGPSDRDADAGAIALLTGDDLGSLMADPHGKEALWRRMVASGMASLDD